MKIGDLFTKFKGKPKKDPLDVKSSSRLKAEKETEAEILKKRHERLEKARREALENQGNWEETGVGHGPATWDDDIPFTH